MAAVWWSFALSCLAVLIAAGSLWYSRGLKLAADRSADAVEAAEERARKAEERNRVDWSLQHIEKSRYALVNKGTETAHGVRVDSGELLAHGPIEIDEFSAGHAEPYIITRSMGTAMDRIVVTWHHKPDLSDEQQRKELLI